MHHKGLARLTQEREHLAHNRGNNTFKCIWGPWVRELFETNKPIFRNTLATLRYYLYCPATGLDELSANSFASKIIAVLLATAHAVGAFAATRLSTTQCGADCRLTTLHATCYPCNGTCDSQNHGPTTIAILKGTL